VCDLVFLFLVVVSWWVSFLILFVGWDGAGVLEIDFAFENVKMGAINRGNIQ
jgi:hypothetical protein